MENTVRIFYDLILVQIFSLVYTILCIYYFTLLNYAVKGE